MMYNVLADIVVTLHFAFLLYVIVGQALIVVGACLRWQWVRNPWFRWSHVACIAIVVVETLAGVTCPLTDLEDWLRKLGGRQTEEDVSFVGRWLRELVFYDIPDDDPVFTKAYVSFGLFVLLTFVLVPPRGCEWICPFFWRRRAAGPVPTGDATSYWTPAEPARQEPRPESRIQSQELLSGLSADHERETRPLDSRIQPPPSVPHDG